MNKKIKKQAFLQKENNGVLVIWFDEDGKKRRAWDNRINILEIKKEFLKDGFKVALFVPEEIKTL